MTMTPELKEKYTELQEKMRSYVLEHNRRRFEDDEVPSIHGFYMHARCCPKFAAEFFGEIAWLLDEIVINDMVNETLITGEMPHGLR